MYEDDNNMRVLGEEEIRHIFAEEEAEEEVQVGDIVSAIWLPNGQWYDAKVLQKGNDKSELMKERIKLEKANKTDDKATKEGQKKRKNQKDAVGQKKKKKPENDDQAEIDRDKDKKAKEKEDKRKKKEEEQRRKDFLLEAKKAQAAERWSSTALDATNFTPEPLRRASNPTPMAHAPVQQTTPPEPSIPAPHATTSQLTDPSSCRTPASRPIPPSSCRIPASCKTPPASGTTLSPASGPTPPSSYRTPTSSQTPDQTTPGGMLRLEFD